MATIYYCKVCDKLLVDEDDLPTVGVYCTKRCEKLAERHGVEGARKEYKKKDKEERPISLPVQTSKELPAEFPAENTPRLRKKKSNINNDNNNSSPARNKIFSMFVKNNNNSNSESDSSSDDAKKKKKKRNGRGHSVDKSKDYDDALEYFRKRSDIPANNIKRDDTRKENPSNNIRVKPKIEPRPISTPTPINNNNNISSNTNTPPSRVVIPEEIPTPPINPNVYSNSKPNPLEDILLSEPSEPPPSYSEIYPDSSNQNEVIDVKDDKPLLEPPLPPRKTEKSKITDYNKPKLPPKPAIPPKLPPKIPIESRNIQQRQSQYQHVYSDDSNQFATTFHVHGSNQYNHYMMYQQPHNNTPSDTYLHEQALPSTLYPPIDYDKYIPPTNNRT